MSDDIRSSICCPSDTPDSPNGDGIYDYRVDRNNPHPPPVVTCPDDFVAWLKEGEYVVPDFSGVITINGLCQVDSEFTITQQPPAGTVIQVGGEVVILIIVIDGHENQVECNFTIDVHDPEDPDTDDPPTVLPPWIYTPYLLFYYTANDTQCTVGSLDEGLPCWFRRDVAGLVGLPTHHLSNGGAAVLERSQSFVAGFTPGPIFNRGSVWSNMLLNAFLYHEDDTALRLLNTDFTVRFAFKLISLDDGGSWNLVGKYDTLGWRVKVERAGSEYRLSPELRNNSTAITTSYRLITLNTWIYVAMTFNAALGRLRLYLDGQKVEETISPGFALSGEVSQFRIGSGVSSNTGLLACWPLDDTNWEDSAEGRTLTASGTVNSVAGKIGNAAQFPITTGGRLSYSADNVLGLVGTSFSVRLWLRITSGVSNPGQIIGKYGGGSGWRIRVTGPLAPYLVDVNINGATTNAPTLLTDSTWHHVVITYDLATTTLRIYINGALDATAVVPAITLGAADFYMGIESAVVGPIELDEVVIFDKQLSGAEVTADYAGGAGTSCPTSSASMANCYHDEIGGWTQEWNAARVLEDYTVMTSFS